MKPPVEAHAGPGGALGFLRAFADAPDDAYIDLGIGTLADGSKVVTCKVGAYQAALTPHEARVIADSAESAMNAYPDMPEAASLPNLILGLRHCADKAMPLPPPPGEPG